MSLEDKIIHAQNVLQIASKLAKTYYNKPLAICYSGGKDSDVLLQIALETLSPDEFEVVNSHTTLDAPETVYYIREKFADLREKGYSCIVKYPYYKGKKTSFWKICQTKKMLPTRIIRFCCATLKETSTPGQIAVLGVRRSESTKRQGRGDIGVRRSESTKRQGRGDIGVRDDWKTAQHVNAMIEFDQDKNNPSSFECQIIKNAKKHNDLLVNPIYDFSEKEVFEFIYSRNLKINPLYNKGFNRIGCIGCPMAGRKRKWEFAQYPIYEKNFLKLCDYIAKNGRTQFNNGLDLFRYWLEEDPKQIRFEDILKENKE